jgi:hypothetical protein
MATNTLIQKLFAADEIASSTDLGQSSVQDSNRQCVERFHCSEVITAGATVALDLSQSSNGLRALVVAEADSADCIPVGIYTGGDAAADSVADTDIDVVIRGFVEEALVNGNTSNVDVGDALFLSANGILVNQRINEGGSGDFNLKSPVAIACETVTADGGTARVFVLKNY